MLIKKKNLEFYECDAFVASFITDLEAAGVVADLEDVPPSTYRASSTHVYLSIQIDPETLRQIFEYSLALFGAYKASSYLQSFLGGLVKGIGEGIGQGVGAKVAEAFTAFWKRAIDAIWKPKKPESRGIDLSVTSEFCSVPISARVGGFYTGTLRDQDQAVTEFMRDQALNQLLAKVMPIAGEFILRAKELGIEIPEVSARLHPTKKDGDTWSLWLWELDVPPVGYFIIEERGQLLPRDRYGFFNRDMSLARVPVINGFDPDEIGRILRKYKRRGWIPKWLRRLTTH